MLGRSGGALEDFAGFLDELTPAEGVEANPREDWGQVIRYLAPLFPVQLASGSVE